MNIKINDTISLIYTKLGQPYFVRYEENLTSLPEHSLCPQHFSISELKDILAYMESNPECSLFSDGSGNIVKP